MVRAERAVWEPSRIRWAGDDGSAEHDAADGELHEQLRDGEVALGEPVGDGQAGLVDAGRDGEQPGRMRAAYGGWWCGA